MASSLSEDDDFFLGKIRKGLAAEGYVLESHLEDFLTRPVDRDALFWAAVGGETRAFMDWFARAIDEALAHDAAGTDRTRVVRDWRARYETVHRNPRHMISLVVMKWFSEGGDQHLRAIGGSRRSYFRYVLALVLGALALALFFILSRP